MPKRNKNRKNQTVISHISDLRDMLISIFIGLIIGFIISYIFVENIYSFLSQPLADALADRGNKRMIFTGLTEAFFTYIKLSFFAGFILSFPNTVYQIYKFVAPGLYQSEKKYSLIFMIASPILFLIGAAFVYYFLFPLAWQFFISFEIPSSDGSMPIELEARVSEYLSIVTTLILAFGVTFQLPIILILLITNELISVDALRKFRKYAVVIILSLAAIITPPDVISQIALATPLLILYEFSIIIGSKLRSKNA